MIKPKPIHLTAIPTLLIALPLLWFALAYGGLPRLWSHHEHKLMPMRRQLVSYTSQDIPGDPINLRIHASPDSIACAFDRVGWARADPVTLQSGLKIAASVLFDRPYPQAPVSPLYVNDREQEVAFQRDEGKSADKRHHLRLWQVGANDWLAAATFDRGVGLNLFTLQITHHIGPDVDRDRDLIAALITANGGTANGEMLSGLAGNQWHRNGGGDRYRTDGAIKVFELGSCR
jgi:hypothetical protein